MLTNEELINELIHTFSPHMFLTWDIYTSLEQVREVYAIVSSFEPSSRRDEILEALEWYKIFHDKELLKDPDVIAASQTESSDPFWHTKMGVYIEGLHESAIKVIDEYYVEPFIEERLAAGAYSTRDAHNNVKDVDWCAEMVLFRKWLLEENRLANAIKDCDSTYLFNTMKYIWTMECLDLENAVFFLIREQQDN